MVVKITSNKKLENLTESILSPARRNRSNNPINEAERFQFQSPNVKMFWTGVISSSFCSFAVLVLLFKTLSC